MFLRSCFLKKLKFDKERLMILTELLKLLKLLKSFIDVIKVLIS